MEKNIRVFHERSDSLKSTFFGVLFLSFIGPVASVCDLLQLAGSAFGRVSDLPRGAMSAPERSFSVRRHRRRLVVEYLAIPLLIALAVHDAFRQEFKQGTTNL